MPTPQADLNNRVNLQPIDATPIRAVDAAAPARAIAQGVADLGRGVGQVSAAVKDINDIYDEAAVARADTLALTRLAEARRRVESAQGFDAQAAQADFTRVAEETQREIATSLANPRQQQMFGDLYSRRVRTETDAAQRHADREVLAARREAGVARITAVSANMVDNYRDPEAEAAGFATVEGELRTIYAGAGPEVLAQKRAEHRSVFRVQVAQSIGANDPIGAQQYVDDHAADILPEQEVAIRSALRPRFDAAMVEGALARVMSSAPTPGAQADAPPTSPEEGVYTAPLPATDGAQPATAEPPARTPPQPRDPLRGRGAGRVSSPFGVRRPGHTHNGVDLPVREGTPVYPPTRGRVVASWFDSRNGGGNSVVVEHPDGRRTGYAHLRNRAVNVGDEVNDHTVLGGSGNTGRSTGPHLHYTVRDANGQHVDPTTQTWGGEGSLPARTPSRAALTDLYGRARAVAEEMGLSQSQYQDLLAGVDRQYSRQEAALRSQREIASDQANEYVSQRQDAGQPVEISQIPGYENMDPSARRALADYVRSGAGRDGSDTFFNLLEQSANRGTQAAFASVDLNQYRARISDAEYRELRREQVAIRNPAPTRGGSGGGRRGTGRDRGVSNAAIREQITLLSGDIGLGDRATGRGSGPRNAARSRNELRLTQMVANDVSNWAAEHPDEDVTPDIINRFIRQNSREVTVTGADTGQQQRVRYYGIRDINNVERVPAADRAQIRAAYRRAHGGREPADYEIVTLYLQR